MATIRNLLLRSPYTVDVYRPVVSQQLFDGIPFAQWVETHSATPVLTGVVALIATDQTLEEALVLGQITARMLKMMWLGDDIREQDVILVHADGRNPLDGKWFAIKKIQPDFGRASWDNQQKCILEELRTSY